MLISSPAWSAQQTPPPNADHKPADKWVTGKAGHPEGDGRSEAATDTDKHGATRIILVEGGVLELEIAALRRLGDVDHVEHNGRQIIVVEDLSEIDIAREVELTVAPAEDRRRLDTILVGSGILRPLIIGVGQAAG